MVDDEKPMGLESLIKRYTDDTPLRKNKLSKYTSLFSKSPYEEFQNLTNSVVSKERLLDLENTGLDFNRNPPPDPQPYLDPTPTPDPFTADPLTLQGPLNSQPEPFFETPEDTIPPIDDIEKEIRVTAESLRPRLEGIDSSCDFLIRQLGYFDALPINNPNTQEILEWFSEIYRAGVDAIEEELYDTFDMIGLLSVSTVGMTSFGEMEIVQHDRPWEVDSSSLLANTHHSMSPEAAARAKAKFLAQVKREGLEDITHTTFEHSTVLADPKAKEIVMKALGEREKRRWGKHLSRMVL